MNRKILVAVMIGGLLILMACGIRPVSSEGPLTVAERLWQEKPALVGDNTAVIHVLVNLPYPGALSYDHVELLTEQEPYGIVVYVQGDENVQDADWIRQTAVVLTIVENADSITWTHVKDETDQATISRDEVADGVKYLSTDPAYFATFVEELRKP